MKIKMKNGGFLNSIPPSGMAQMKKIAVGTFMVDRLATTPST